ncbi:MAG TPA: NADH-quinone oxidoreductase subunit N [Myxococcales bacterium]|nr:NADH-quinone oxidoreductase subunit N [Myxococcales bacterium]
MLGDLLITLPMGIVTIMGCFVLLADVFSGSEDRRFLGHLTAAGMVTAIAVAYLLWGGETLSFATTTFGNVLAMGRFELVACSLLLMIGLGVAMISFDHAADHGFSYGEYYALLNFSVLGMMVMVCATHMITLFLGLEIMSISIYILVCVKRTSAFSAEAGLKYFVLGSFASALLIFGIAYIYGETASLGYSDILAALTASEPSGYLALALFMLIGAFAFKVALVPFHMWTPDVYEGAPTPVTALMATGVKTAAVLSMARLFIVAFPPSALAWIGPNIFDLLGILAVVTMTTGNLIALHQKSVKRMLAYSSVAHAGYLLIGVMAAHAAAVPGSASLGVTLSSVLFYLFVYALANLAAFGVITMIEGDKREGITLDHVSGMSQRLPLAAFVLAIAMLSLAGIPPTAGFFGKLALFRDALIVDQDKFLWLVIIALLNSVVSVYYYLRVIVHAYMHEVVRNVTAIRSTALILALVLTMLGTLHAGVFPNKYFNTTSNAAKDFARSATQAIPSSSKTPDLAAVE